PDAGAARDRSWPRGARQRARSRAVGPAAARREARLPPGPPGLVPPGARAAREACATRGRTGLARPRAVAVQVDRDVRPGRDALQLGRARAVSGSARPGTGT